MLTRILDLFFTYLMLLLSVGFSTCSKDEPLRDLREESAHFIILTNSKNSTSSEISQVLTQAEQLYERIAAIVGEAHTPVNKITIRMEGSFTDQGPYFNDQGIHIFRYSREENGYLSLLAHEMVHAFREPFYLEKETWNWPAYPYFDEGFSEYIAQLVDSTKTGFPFYGFPESVVVGHMVLHKQHIPHTVMRGRHEAFNQPCNIQTYPARASWCRYIDEVYGRDALFALIFAEQEPTALVVQEVIGVDLSVLDQDWETWIVEKYQEIKDADRIAQQYLERVSWYAFCDS